MVQGRVNHSLSWGISFPGKCITKGSQWALIHFLWRFHVCRIRYYWLAYGLSIRLLEKKKKICLSAASKRSLIILHSAVTDVTVMVYLRSNTANAWHTLYPKYLNIAGRMCFPASICWIVEFRDFYEAEGTLQKLSGEQQSDCFTRIIPCVQIMYVLLSFVCMTNYREVPYWEMQ